MPPKQVIQPKTNVSHKWIPYTVYVADQIVSYIDPTVGTIKNFCMNTGFSSVVGTPPTTTGILNTGWSLTGSGGSGGGGVSQIKAGAGITISPTTGYGVVAVSQTTNSINGNNGSFSYSSAPITTAQTTLFIGGQGATTGLIGGITNIVFANQYIEITNTFGGTPIITSPNLTMTTPTSSFGGVPQPYWNFTSSFIPQLVAQQPLWTPIKTNNQNFFLGLMYQPLPYSPYLTVVETFNLLGQSPTFTYRGQNQDYQTNVNTYFSTTPYPVMTLGTLAQQTANALEMVFSSWEAVPPVGSYFYDAWPSSTPGVAPLVVSAVNFYSGGLMGVIVDRVFYKGGGFDWGNVNLFASFSISTTTTASPYPTTDTLLVTVGMASAVIWTATGTYPNLADPVYVPSSGLFYRTSGGSVVGSSPVNGVNGWSLTSSNDIINNFTSNNNLTYLTIPGNNTLKAGMTRFTLSQQFVETFPQSPFSLDPFYKGRAYFVSATLGVNNNPSWLSPVLTIPNIVVLALD